MERRELCLEALTLNPSFVNAYNNLGNNLRASSCASLTGGA